MVKSVYYPNELVATRKGSPLLIGVKSEQKLKVDFVDVEFINEPQQTNIGGHGLSNNVLQLPSKPVGHVFQKIRIKSYFT
ncbi:unnamed protein product [[Candida] boidinii]|nr:unnamed protein product [[Candida] boidinii]